MSQAPLTTNALLARVRVVLCRPRTPGNVGAAARALRCAGISKWTLVDPQCDPLDPDATRMAVHAEGMLQLAQIAPTLEDALKNATVSFGTTARNRFERPPLPPQAACDQIIEAAHGLLLKDARPSTVVARAAPRVRRKGGNIDGGEIALVFGDERAGLTTEEVEICDRVTSIPSAPEQPSWNLAQAIAIYAFSLRTSALATETRLAAESGQQAPIGGRAHGKQNPPHKETRMAADASQMAHLDGHLSKVLTLVRRDRLRRRLLISLDRARLTNRESVLWTALFEQLRRAIDPDSPRSSTHGLHPKALDE